MGARYLGRGVEVVEVKMGMVGCKQGTLALSSPAGRLTGKHRQGPGG